MSRRALERHLQDLAGFEEPRVDLEQYTTPADVASHLLHLADLQGDLSGRVVVDLGTGAGVLALGAAQRGPRRVVGVDVDAAALATARANERRLGSPPPIAWVRGDATRVPLCPDGPVTVVMNPPFGAQRGNVHADREFLVATAELATVSYSIHNRESRPFVEAFADDHGGSVTHGFAASIPIERQFPFHEEPTREFDVEVFRIEWGQDGPQRRP